MGETFYSSSSSTFLRIALVIGAASRETLGWRSLLEHRRVYLPRAYPVPTYQLYEVTLRYDGHCALTRLWMIGIFDQTIEDCLILIQNNDLWKIRNVLF